MNSASDLQQHLGHNNRSNSRLANPTAYHMQQMRYKESIGIDPSQMMDGTSLLFVHQQQQQQQQESPNLSDLDYSELANSSPMTGELSARYRTNEGDYNFDQAIKQQQHAYAIQMKRSSTEVETSAGLVGHSQQYNNNKFNGQPQGYYSNSFENNDNGNRLKQFAGSAPSNMGYHGGLYSSFAGSDDMMSVAASQSTQYTGTTKNYQKDNDSEIMDDNYPEDYSNQAK